MMPCLIHVEQSRAHANADYTNVYIHPRDKIILLRRVATRPNLLHKVLDSSLNGVQ